MGAASRFLPDTVKAIGNRILARPRSSQGSRRAAGIHKTKPCSTIWP
jgi:hypothetical protein